MRALFLICLPCSLVRPHLRPRHVMRASQRTLSKRVRDREGVRMRNRRQLLYAMVAGAMILSISAGTVTFLVTRNAGAAPHSSTSVGTLKLVGDGSLGAGGIVSIDQSKHDQTPQEEEHDIKVPNHSGSLPPPPT